MADTPTSARSERGTRIVTPKMKPAHKGSVGLFSPPPKYDDVASPAKTPSKSPAVIPPYATRNPVPAPSTWNPREARPSSAPVTKRDWPARNPILEGDGMAAKPLRKVTNYHLIHAQHGDAPPRPLRGMRKEPGNAAGLLSGRAFVWPNHRASMKTALPKPSEAKEDPHVTGDTRMGHPALGHFATSVQMRDILGQHSYVGVDEFKQSTKKLNYKYPLQRDYAFHGAAIEYTAPEKEHVPQLRPGTARPDLSIRETSSNVVGEAVRGGSGPRGQVLEADMGHGIRTSRVAGRETPLCRDTLGYSYALPAHRPAAQSGQDQASRRAAYEAGLRGALTERAASTHAYNLNRARGEATNTALTSFLYGTV